MTKAGTGGGDEQAETKQPVDDGSAAAEENNAQLCASLLREHHDEILAGWVERVKILPCAQKLDRSGLIDHIPEVLDRIAERMDELSPVHLVMRSRTDAASIHALERYEQSFDLAAVVTELGMLRSCILLSFEDVQLPVAAVRILDEAIDLMVTAAIEGYVGVRERTLRVFDQIATAVLDCRTLEELVPRLLEILVGSSEAIDTAALLLPKGDAMRVRASIGEDQTKDPAWTFLAEGVAVRVATSRQAFELPAAKDDPLISRAELCRERVRALYAIPLIDDTDVVAVLHMGSRTADEFSLDDRRLLRAVGVRATAVIRQHVLREAAERSANDLQKREEEFHALADNIPQFAWMANARGTPYWCNQRWLAYSGTTLDQMRASGPMAFVHPDHVQRVTEISHQAVASGEPFEATFPLRSRSGIYRWFLCRAIPIRGMRGTIARWFGTHTDVTEQRFLDEATKLLNASLNYQETLQQIVRLAVPDLADSCVVHLVEDDEVRRVADAHVNPDGSRLMAEWERKYPLSWGTDRGLPGAIRSGEPLLVPTISDELLVQVATSDDHLRDLRELRLVSCIIAPLMARGRSLGAVTFVTAESNRTYGNAELEVATELARRAGTAVDNARLYKESQQALSERQAAVRLREEVLAIVSHDLRGPLNTIGMSTSLLEETYPDADSNKRLDLIHRSADHMEHMIEDLLDMATIEAKALTLRRELVDAERLVAAVVEAQEESAARTGIELVRDCSLQAVHVACDRERIERVFTNLIGNSLKFCGPGDVITVAGHVAEGAVVFSVTDTGPGIPADQVAHLFERYWTSSSREGAKGTGLGLYICKGIVDAHGGRLWVESVVGRGTKFSFTLPLVADARAWRPPETQPRQHP